MTADNPTALGRVILDRMAVAGITKQSELAARAGVSASTVTRLLYTELRTPHPPTLRALSTALGLDPDHLYLVACGDTPPRSPRQIHPLAAELDRILSDDSPQLAATRRHLAWVVDAVLQPARVEMGHLIRERRRNSGD